MFSAQEQLDLLVALSARVDYVRETMVALRGHPRMLSEYQEEEARLLQLMFKVDPERPYGVFESPPDRG